MHPLPPQPSRATAWLAPVAGSLAVLAAVLVPTALAGSRGSSAGPGPDRHVVQPTYPNAGRRGDGTQTVPVRLTGYRGAGRTVQLFYRVSPRDDCSTTVLHPVDVHFIPGALRVRLERTPKRQAVEGCDGRVLDDTVSVRLRRPLGDRLVEDVDNFGQIVPYGARSPQHRGR